MNAARLWTICQRVGHGLYDKAAPNHRYGECCARLLFGTAAQESALVWERQRTPRWDGAVGGFSKWQLESGSIQSGMRQLQLKPGLAASATMLVFADRNASVMWCRDMDLSTILWALRMDDNDMFGCVLARLHYMRCPGAVPESIEGQAAYWKKWYNTPSGKGTEMQFIENWNRYCAVTVEGS